MTTKHHRATWGVREVSFALAFAAGIVAWTPWSGALAASTAATHTVVIEGLSYAPATLTVKRGDTVTWQNKDPFPHTVTAKGAFDSKTIAAGKSWRYTARKEGTFDYGCTFHPNMAGTLKVE